MLAQLSEWVSPFYIELAAAFLGIVYIILSTRQNILTWPAGLVSSVLYILVFFKSKFYAGMGLQLYYVGMSLYGWYYWLHGNRNNNSEKVPVVRMSFNNALGFGIVTFFAFLIFYQVLKHYTDSPVPFMDSLTTAMGITATWMLARKILENWLVWIVTDLLSIALYLQRGLWPTSFLFLVYTILAVYGYFQWKRAMRTCPE